jgi:hypothetical protein
MSNSNAEETKGLLIIKCQCHADHQAYEIVSKKNLAQKVNDNAQTDSLLVLKIPKNNRIAISTKKIGITTTNFA